MRRWGIIVFFPFILPIFFWSVVIKSDPVGAEVRVGGICVGKTPLVLSNGTGLVEVSLPGYKAVTQVVHEQKQIFVRLLPTNSLLTFIKQEYVGSMPKDLIFTPDGRYLVITFMGEQGIGYYDMKEAKLSMVRIPQYHRYVGYVEGVFSPDGKEFWFTQVDKKGKVFVVSLSNWSIVKEIDVQGSMPKVGEFTPDGRYYYVTCWDSATVTVIERETYQVREILRTTGYQPRGLGFSQDGHYLYVLFYGSGEIIKYDRTQGHKVVKTIKTGGSNGRFRLHPHRNWVYINNLRRSRFYILDLSTDTLSAPYACGIHPSNLKLSPDYRYMVITCRGKDNSKGFAYRSPEDGTVELYDIKESVPRLLEVIKGGNQPIGIAISSDGKILAISNFMDGTVDFYLVDTERL
ncbi:cytochrome D1 domain-containing protein [Thermospira aquatica]|uniref:Beta-propeller fold lactonase family protein n=1 Tax=Thermospira aquatica TaxID=2828656 RepID=A0AAX3BB54_9SPIR|nr:cytochrome D1 domain-containing protein [Thermospira aquatica]URA09479.1 beta-propeller fold lactonase family protein [Thermospira aquatica]